MKKISTILLVAAMTASIAMPAQAFWGSGLSDVEERIMKEDPSRVNPAGIEGFEDFVSLTVFEMREMSQEEVQNYKERGEKYQAAVKAKKKAERAARQAERKRKQEEAERKYAADKARVAPQVEAAMAPYDRKQMTYKDVVAKYPNLTEWAKGYNKLAGLHSNVGLNMWTYPRKQYEESAIAGIQVNMDSALKQYKKQAETYDAKLAQLEEVNQRYVDHKKAYPDFEPSTYQPLQVNKDILRNEQHARGLSGHWVHMYKKKLVKAYLDSVRFGNSDMNDRAKAIVDNYDQYKAFMMGYLPRHANAIWPEEYPKYAKGVKPTVLPVPPRFNRMRGTTTSQPEAEMLAAVEQMKNAIKTGAEAIENPKPEPAPAPEETATKEDAAEKPAESAKPEERVSVTPEDNKKLDQFEKDVVAAGMTAEKAKVLRENLASQKTEDRDAQIAAKLGEVKMLMGFAKKAPAAAETPKAQEEVTQAAGTPEPTPNNEPSTQKVAEITSTASAPAEAPKADNRATFDALLAEGQQRVKKYRLKSPKGQSAYDTYNAMTQYPEYKEEAEAFRCSIADRYAQLGVSKANGDFTPTNMKKAVNFFNKAKAICVTPYMEQASATINKQVQACNNSDACQDGNVTAKKEKPKKKDEEDGFDVFGVKIRW
ncbi:hypothetical protein [Neptuniibacter sp. QD37_11]|uniref:hypothetical protein n=1 Tax=Neptuniibacter sp. QD37_11 TaxID=3398209 RepID=UPI0039F55C0C